MGPHHLCRGICHLGSWAYLAVLVSNSIKFSIWAIYFPIEGQKRPLTSYYSKYKSFSLIGLHPLCATLFTAGYILREIGAYNSLYSPRNLIIFIISQVFIYICP